MEVLVGEIIGHREKDSGHKVQTLRYNTTKLFLFIIYYMDTNVLLACISVYHMLQCLGRSEEGIESPANCSHR